MPNELPKQYYILRLILKSGATFDVVTEMTEEQCRVEMAQNMPLIKGWNHDKNWAVNLTLTDKSQVDAFFHSPYKQDLSQRSNLSIS